MIYTGTTKIQQSLPRYYNGHYLYTGAGDKLDLGGVGSFYIGPGTERVTDERETATVTPTVYLKRVNVADFFPVITLKFSKKLTGNYPIKIETSMCPNAYDSNDFHFTLNGEWNGLLGLRFHYGLFYSDDRFDNRNRRLNKTITPKRDDTEVTFDLSDGDIANKVFYTGAWEFNCDMITVNPVTEAVGQAVGLYLRITYGSYVKYLNVRLPNIEGTNPKYTDRYDCPVIYEIPEKFTNTDQRTRITTFTL